MAILYLGAAGVVPFIDSWSLVPLLVIVPAAARALFKRITIESIGATLAYGVLLDWLFHEHFPYYTLWLGLYVILVRNIEEYVDFHHAWSPLFLAMGAFVWSTLYDFVTGGLIAGVWRMDWHWLHLWVLLGASYLIWYVSGGSARETTGSPPTIGRS